MLGWQLAALKAAQDARLSVPRQTMAMAGRFLDSVQANDGASYGYKEPGTLGASTTAIGLLGRLQLNEWNRSRLTEGVSRVVEQGPSDDCYFNYYATTLMSHYGGKAWEDWKCQIKDYLLKAQEDGPEVTGSWYDAIGEGVHVKKMSGRLGTTCFCLLTLLETME